jgi:beta-glucosidase
MTSSSPASTQATSHFPASAEARQQAKDLLAQMTLEEKIGQLVQFSMQLATGPEHGQIQAEEMISKGGLGSILNTTGAAKINQLQKVAVENSRLKIPLLYGLDVIHGYRTIFPISLGLAASWNTDLIEKTARVAAVEATSEGIRWTFAPMIDIGRDARWGRMMESPGEDTYLGCKIAQAYVKGYQGDDLTAPTSMVACAKHFAAYGAVESGKEYNTAEVSDRTLRETHLPTFKAAVDAGVGTFMSGFSAVHGVPPAGSRRLLTEILRDEWGFEGFVVSDWAAVGELIQHGIARDLKECAKKALYCGVDMDMCASAFMNHLLELVEEGKVPVEEIDQSVHRILLVKCAMGLLENPYTDETLSEKVILCDEHIAVAREAAEKSFVLLKNEGALLPLQPGKKIALIGPLADNADDMLGEWACAGRKEDVVSLKAAFDSSLAGQFVYAKGTEISGESEDGFAEAVAAAASADVVVMALGESRWMSGEALSRTEIGLPGNQQALLKAVAATGKPIVLLVFCGRPLALPTEVSLSNAVMISWFPGVQAGPALVRVLTGEASPEGRLTVSFPRSLGQVPIYYNALNTGRPAPTDAAAQRFMTGYLDEKTSPLFTFGEGLTYTTFDYSETSIFGRTPSAAEIEDGAVIEVQATVTNSGTQAGTEVVQLYINQRATSISRPVRELKGFERVTLAPGESRKVRFMLTKEELSFYSLDMVRRVEPCDLTLWVAPNASAGTPVTVELG